MQSFFGPRSTRALAAGRQPDEFETREYRREAQSRGGRWRLGIALAAMVGLASRAQAFNDLYGAYYEVGGAGSAADGVGVGFASLDSDPRPDMVLMMYDNPDGANSFRYWVLLNFGTDGKHTSVANGGSYVQVGGFGSSGDGAGVALGNIDGDAGMRPDMVVMAYDAPSGPNNFRYAIGWNLNASGIATAWSGYIQVPGVGYGASGAGAALTNLDGNSRPELVLMAYDHDSNPNRYKYRIGWNISTAGVATSWSDVKEYAGVTDNSQGAGVALYSQGGNTVPDMLLMAYDDYATQNKFHYIRGYDVSSAGIPSSVSGAYEAPGVGDTGEGADLALVDLDENGYRDLVLVAYDDYANTFRYRIVPDFASPEIQIASPLANQVVKGVVTVSVSPASIGFTAQTQIELFRDSRVRVTSGTGVTQLQLDTRPLANGTHKLWVRALEGAIYAGFSAPITVNVQNPVCNDGNVCNGTETVGTNGACVAGVNQPTSTQCRAARGFCDVADYCDGNGACSADRRKGPETLCRAAQEWWEDLETGDVFPTCDAPEYCTGTSDECPADGNAGPEKTCRPASGPCDAAEVCDGTAFLCPDDALLPMTTVCRPPAGACDVGEFCGYNWKNCPADSYKALDTTCRTSAGPCDVAEFCTGAGAECPTDGFVSSTSVCRKSAGDCDVAEQCTGTSAPCPADALRPNTYACRSSAGPCDVAETCSGASSSCPTDAFRPNTYVCRAAVGACDVAESCSGGSAQCPADAFASSSTICRAVAGPCDIAETCSGANASCPADALASSTTVCRAAAGACDAVEYCSGTSISCPADALVAQGTPCEGELGCACNATGVCIAGASLTQYCYDAAGNLTTRAVTAAGATCRPPVCP